MSWTTKDNQFPCGVNVHNYCPKKELRKFQEEELLYPPAVVETSSPLQFIHPYLMILALCFVFLIMNYVQLLGQATHSIFFSPLSSNQTSNHFRCLNLSGQRYRHSPLWCHPIGPLSATITKTMMIAERRRCASTGHLATPKAAHHSLHQLSTSPSASCVASPATRPPIIPAVSTSAVIAIAIHHLNLNLNLN
jgi:hypothetical protein